MDQHLALALQELGLPDYLFALDRRRPEEMIWNPTLTNWPEIHRDFYISAGLPCRDPHLDKLSSRQGAFIWRPTDWSGPEVAPFAEFLSTYGLAGGISVPLAHKPGRHSAMMLVTQCDAVLTSESLHLSCVLAHMTMARFQALTTRPNALTEEALQRLDQLSELQLSVLSWVAQGKTNREIAIILDRSRRAIDYHLEQIFSKLGVATRTQAALLYLGADS